MTFSGTERGGQTLTASLADPDGPPSGQMSISSTWQWMRAATSTGTFTNISSATSATYTLIAADVGMYLKAEASYTDGHGASKSATSDATGAIAANNSEPTFSSMTTTRSVNENTAANTDIGMAVTATDSDMGDTLTYALTGTDVSSFNFDTGTGQIKTKAALNHETKDSYSVIVTVRDSKDAAGDDDTAVDATITVTINISDVNDAPTITSGSSAFSKDENTQTSTVIQTYQASDEDSPAQTFSWDLEGTDAGDFEINFLTGALAFKSVPNYELPADNGGNNVYNITVKVTDNGSPAMNNTLAVTITVNDVNEAPDITTSDTTKSVPENTTSVLTFDASDVDAQAGNTLSWSVESADDGGKLSIDSSSGALTFSAAPNFEDPLQTGSTDNEYKVTVKVTDNGIPGNRGSTLSDTHVLTVNVTNVNEVPTITTTQATHVAPSKMEIEYDDTSPDLSVVTYEASDPDTQTGNTLTWSIEGDDAGDFDIDSGTGALTFQNPPNYEIPTGTPATPGDDPDNTYEITVKVRDNGIPIDRSMGNQLEATLNVIVTVTDVNERPDISEDTVPNYPEVGFYFDGTPDMVHTFTATDYDDMDSDPFTWSLGGDDAGDFSIGSADGMSHSTRTPAWA